MSGVEQTEKVVLSGAEAGNYMASVLATQGGSTMVIERPPVAGSCPNINVLFANVADRGGSPQVEREG